jgi:hypothetical protein
LESRATSRHKAALRGSLFFFCEALALHIGGDMGLDAINSPFMISAVMAGLVPAIPIL